MKAVVLDGYTLNPGDISWKEISDIVSLDIYDRTDGEHVAKRIKDAEIIFTNKVLITKAVLDACPSLRYIGVLATGYNVVDTAAAAERGIIVTNTPAYGTEAVAQHVFALLLELCNHVQNHDKAVKSGKWTSCPDFCFWEHPLIELNGKTIGLIGYGRIGRLVARIALAFGMKVLSYDQNAAACPDLPDVALTSLDEVFRKSDVISLHCPLTADTENMINKKSIGMMRDQAFIINTSRGQLVEEQDLAEALSSGKLGGAGLDVLRKEPPDADNPLLSAPNCIITPHIAWAARESRERLMAIAACNLKMFLKGEPVNVV